jgi:hypothetical protein
MSIPASHLRKLRKDLEGHAKRLDHLREQISRLAEEASAHESILKIGRDERVLKAVNDLTDPNVASEMKRDQKSFLRQRGLGLPEGSEVDVRRKADRTTVSVQLTQGPWKYSCVWDSEDGFSVTNGGGER